MREKTRSVFSCIVSVVAVLAIVFISYARSIPSADSGIRSDGVPSSGTELSDGTATGSNGKENTSDGTVVYFTPTGTKYHFDRNCRYIINSKTVTEISIEEAIEDGKTPCSACAVDK